VVFTPKSLLRHPQAVSTLDEMAAGSFHRVLGDEHTDPTKVTRILLCSGKVYFDLAAERARREAREVAIVRLEQYYPLGDSVTKALAPYREGTPVVWVQEEPRNMGPWYFVNARRAELLGGRFPLAMVSRPESASPATGSKAAHDIEQKMLLEEAFGASVVAS
jgi:2-oxoglutarate dehydrogenase E1 component